MTENSGRCIFGQTVYLLPFRKEALQRPEASPDGGERKRCHENNHFPSWRDLVDDSSPDHSVQQAWDRQTPGEATHFLNETPLEATSQDPSLASGLRGPCRGRAALEKPRLQQRPSQGSSPFSHPLCPPDITLATMGGSVVAVEKTSQLPAEDFTL